MIWRNAKRLLLWVGFLFYTFVTGISLFISISLELDHDPDIYGPVTFWAITLVLVLIGVLLVVRPTNTGWPQRSIAAIIFTLIFAFYHQYIIAFPGRVAEAIFAANLKPGMTRDGTERLARQTFGSDTGDFPSAVKYPDPEAQFVFYTDWVSVCVGGGKLYVVHFDSAQHVTSWNVYPWVEGC